MTNGFTAAHMFLFQRYLLGVLMKNFVCHAFISCMYCAYDLCDTSNAFQFSKKFPINVVKEYFIVTNLIKRDQYFYVVLLLCDYLASAGSVQLEDCLIIANYKLSVNAIICAQLLMNVYKIEQIKKNVFSDISSI